MNDRSPKDEAAYGKRMPETDAMLKQFQKYANMGDNVTEFRARYEFTFWPTEKQQFALALMDGGSDFMQAYRDTLTAYAGA
jgi:hypothetical protein